MLKKDFEMFQAGFDSHILMLQNLFQLGLSFDNMISSSFLPNVIQLFPSCARLNQSNIVKANSVRKINSFMLGKHIDRNRKVVHITKSEIFF